jgi:hypothetical protein
MKSPFHRSVLALAAIGLVAGASLASAQQQSQRALKKYESGTKEFWTHPPDDWFLGDETEAQKGLAPPSGPPTGASDAELAALIKKIKLPSGFKIEVWASGVLAARQMAWGDKGTLFVGSFGLGNVYAITDKDGKKEVKTILKGLNMPTGLAFRDGALYVIAVDKLIKYENAEANLDKLGDGTVVYDDMPSTPRMAGNISRSTRTAGSTFRSDLRSTSAFPRPASRRSAASIRRPATPKSMRSASATRSAATSIRAPASTGSRRMRATGSATTCPQTSSTSSTRSASISAIPIVTRATCLIRNSRWATSARSSRRRLIISARTWLRSA